MRQQTDSVHEIKWSGFVIAVVGFLLTRLTVLDAIQMDTPTTEFLLDHGVVLVPGLGVTLFGVALAVSTFDRRYVNTVAAWCVLGTAGILAITGLGMVDEFLLTGSMPTLTDSTGTVFSHALMGGAVGGVLIGMRSAADQRHRIELSRQADRLTVLNRVIRHVVLNASNAIHGHASLLASGEAPDESTSFDAIERGVSHIDSGVREVSFLAAAARDGETVLTPVGLQATVETALESMREEHPDVTFAIEGELPRVEVWATRELANALEYLLDNAANHNEADEPLATVSVDVGRGVAAIRVQDNGPGIPEEQRDILLGGDLPEYDDPTTGFGLPLVRLLTEQFGGRVSVATGPNRGTTVTLALVRADQPRPGSETFGLEPRELLVVAGAALVAGVSMGVVLQLWVQAVPVIGGLYGVQRLGVGWSMHLFHSVVFGFTFAVATEKPPFGRDTMTTLSYVLLGVAWGLVLWFLAAGFVMPVMLWAAGLPAPIPLLTLPSLVGHVLWGALLGLLFGALS